MRKFIFCFFAFAMGTSVVAQRHDVLYVGTFSVRGSEGIYVFEFNRTTASFNRMQAEPGPASPSFITIHPNSEILYSVNRGAIDGGSAVGSVVSYAIDQTNGRLKKINSISSLGEGPCHVEVDPSGRFVVVSHYVSGTLAVFSLTRDGALGTLTDSIRFSGKGPNQERQGSPHIHSAKFVPNTNTFFVADLGTDRLYTYTLGERGKLNPASPPFVSLFSGAGPRHVAVHPVRKTIYATEELTSTVAVLTRRKDRVELWRDTIRALPVGFEGFNTSADIHVSPDGKYLYASQRGHHSLTIFDLGKKGIPILVSHQNTGGITPRNFLITDDGEFLFVANQDSDNVVAFRRNAKTGALTKVGEVSVPSPVCLRSIERKN